MYTVPQKKKHHTTNFKEDISVSLGQVIVYVQLKDKSSKDKNLHLIGWIKIFLYSFLYTQLELRNLMHE